MTIEGGESISEPHKDGYLSWFPPYENRVGWGTLVCETASSALSAKMFCATPEERRYHAGDD